MEESEKKHSVYRGIIWDYINAVNAQMNIVPISYNFLSAQIVTEGKKVEKFSKEHGELGEEDGKEYICMPLEYNAVFAKMMRNLGNTALAFELTGVNAVIGIVSRYDGFLADLMKLLFADKPEILNGSDKEFKASDILTYADFNELKEVLVEKEIETLLRKNHVDQLQWLEAKLKLTLKDFKLFPDFVEIMERRNLFVHANGIVSRQYISECKKNGYTLPEGLKPGDRLDADMAYVRKAYKVLFQVGIMLGFVIWHKIRPQEGEEMMDSLSEVAYDLIKDEEFTLGLDIIDFALTNKSWAKEINFAQQLIFRVNKALAFHLRDMQDECVKIADSMDVTAADPVYHLAVAVLKMQYSEAYVIMDKIGKDDDMRGNYKTWPLFNKIRQEKAFVEKFKEIYDEEYECNDTHISNFEEVIKSALELVERTKEMMSKEQTEEQVAHVEDADIAEDVKAALIDNSKEGD